MLHFFQTKVFFIFGRKYSLNTFADVNNTCSRDSIYGVYRENHN